MSLDGDYKLAGYVHRCDNPFAVVANTAQMAREKCEDWKGVVSESEALTWVIQNEPPKVVKDLGIDFPSRTKMLKEKQLSKYRFIDDFLSGIDDLDIRQAVKDSYIASLKKKNLVYCYNEITNQHKQGRIRVLTRMLWNSGMK